MTDASTPKGYFTDDHRACDALWSKLEGAVDGKDDAAARRLWEQFDGAMRRHFTMEEEVLFPAIENATGMHGGGPTEVMRSEHIQMRMVLEQMAAEVERGDLQALLDHGDTLLMLIQQHNVKEEGILYPLADQALGTQWSELHGKLQSY